MGGIFIINKIKKYIKEMEWKNVQLTFHIYLSILYKKRNYKIKKKKKKKKKKKEKKK